MKKIIGALALVVLLGSSCAMADQVDGVWNLKFGMSREFAGKIMVEKNSAVRVTEYTYQPGYSEALYLVNFFGREGTLFLRFSKKGLYLARFSFDRKEDKIHADPPAPAPEDPEPAPEAPKVIDGRDDAPEKMKSQDSRPQKPEEKPLTQSRNFLHLKNMLTKKYGTPATEIKNDEVAIGYDWKFVKGTHILLFEDRFVPGNQAVMTYEAPSFK